VAVVGAFRETTMPIGHPEYSVDSIHRDELRYFQTTFSASPLNQNRKGRRVDDFENPYLPPSSDDTAPDANPADIDDDVDPRTIGKARYVPWVAVSMIIHGVLMLVAALGLIGMIVFFVPQFSEQIEQQQKLQRQQNPNAPQLPQNSMTTILYITYGAMSAFLFVIGLLGIYAGIRNYGYQNRILGIITMVLNMGSILFCWCLPFSIGLLIFGMIIYLSPEADRAFRWQTDRSNA
jgi:hypothetical protein